MERIQCLRDDAAVYTNCECASVACKDGRCIKNGENTVCKRSGGGGGAPNVVKGRSSTSSMVHIKSAFRHDSREDSLFRIHVITCMQS
jgi:hypothetical protein